MKQIEIESAINAQREIIMECKSKLAQTDYVVIRAQEQGLELSSDFVAERQSWRDNINVAETAIESLKAEVPEEEVREVAE